MISEVHQEPAGPHLDLSPLFPPGIFAYVTLRGFPGVDSETLEDFLEKTGHRRVRVHRVEQVHSARVAHFRESPCPADALIGDEPGHGVRVVAADCVPVLLATTDGKRVAAVHAGWRGTLARITAVAARALQDGTGRELVAYVGPSIGPCCYNVGGERIGLFRDAFPDIPIGEGGSGSLDLPLLNVHQLHEAGLRPGSIHVEERCTACSVGLCCSYRRDGEKAGRMAALVGRTSWPES